MYDQIKYDNKLLGNFSIYGNYKIEPKIKECLIKEIKFFQERKGNVVYVSRALDKIVLNFKITFNIVGKSQQAFLDFIEREQRFDEENIIHTTRIAEIVKYDHEDFVNYVYKQWNVFMSYQSISFEDDAILRMFRETNANFAKIAQLLGVSSQIYVMSMMPILKNMGKEGNLVVNQYNTLLNKITLKNPQFCKNGINLKKLMDFLLSKNKLLPFLATQKESRVVIKEFVSPFKDIKFKKEQEISLDKDKKTLSRHKDSLDKNFEK